MNTDCYRIKQRIDIERRMIISDKPIKIITEGITLESEFAKYFQKTTGYKLDKVVWRDDGMCLEASVKISISDIEIEI